MGFLQRWIKHMRKRMRVRVVSQIAATLRLWVDFSTSILSRLGGRMQSEEAMLEEIGKMQGSGGAAFSFDFSSG